MPSSPGSSAQLRDASSGTRKPPAPSASTTSAPLAKRGVRRNDARRVDRDAGFGRRDVRRDRGLEKPGIHERVGWRTLDSACSSSASSFAGPSGPGDAPAAIGFMPATASARFAQASAGGLP